MLSSTEAAWMVSYEVMGGPLADASVWRGALLWAIALYVPLSAPLSTLESSLKESELPESVRQPVLVISSLLLALAVGVLTQLGPRTQLNPSWVTTPVTRASSRLLITSTG